ncbi:NADH-quinone oxidoreductase subunit A [Halobacteriales archaeon SW_8_65_20]|nr:MAG: NADH-quinone oxidoreductase subunit A [Halobacteriales archaeon QH_7_65_31]PSQ31702.1 MAG: NADH-quinone oxidoreductase subunit A [Halobacteriales archaeon SW_6_65_46]PSQ51682.1 MAG: NADH-quinone oxidoreductase subunit A [Halobacteriales archaeon SW_8_65_20]
MSNPWIAIGALAVVAVVIPVSMIAVSSLLRPSVPEQGKTTVYESGEIPTGDTRIQFNIQYYMIALLFVVFDIETVLIFPWTVIYNDAVSQFGMGSALLPMLAFIGVLVIGLAWAWRNGAVRWVSSDRARETTGGAQ